MRTSIALLLSVVSLLFNPQLATAGPNAEAALVLHIEDPGGADLCLSSRLIPGCWGINEQMPVLGTPVYVYVLVERANATAGVGEVSFGIDYGPGGGLSILGWSLCADHQVSFGWPGPSSGLVVSWEPGNCQHRISGNGDPDFDGGAAVVGYFYCAAYAPAQLALIPNPQNSRVVLTSCDGIEDILSPVAPPSRLGAAGFGGFPGYVPCRVLDVWPCSISGPDSCIAGSAGNEYSSYAPGGLSTEWTITGNGAIVGTADGSAVTVQAGAPGTFRLHCVIRGYVESYVCNKTVTVVGPTAVRATSWGGIKVLHRGSRD